MNFKCNVNVYVGPPLSLTTVPNLLSIIATGSLLVQYAPLFMSLTITHNKLLDYALV